MDGRASARRRLWYMASPALIVLGGCHGTHPWVRPEPNPPAVIEGGTASEGDLGLTAAEMAPETKGFFKANRLSGGWSDQAREIESDLGAR